MESNFKLVNDETGSEFLIENQLLIFGRASDTGFNLDVDSGASDYHAVIVYKHKNLYLMDLISSNGTYLNGNRISAAVKLNHNDKITFGNYSLRVVDLEMRSETVLFDSPASIGKTSNPVNGNFLKVDVNNSFKPNHPALNGCNISLGGSSPNNNINSNIFNNMSEEEKSRYPRLMVDNKDLLNIKVDYFYPLYKDSIIIGRAEGNDIVIPEPSISGQHFVIMIQDKKCFIRNLSKTNGTFVNQNPIKNDVLLNSKDVIACGRVEFKIILPSDWQGTQFYDSNVASSPQKSASPKTEFVDNEKIQNIQEDKTNDKVFSDNKTNPNVNEFIDSESDELLTKTRIDGEDDNGEGYQKTIMRN